MIRYRTVFFDCDSTLTRLEGIDRLAGDRPELAALTAAAMAGDARLEDVYRSRLELVRPGRDAVARLATDGMWMAQLLDLAPPEGELHEQVLERILAMIAGD